MHLFIHKHCIQFYLIIANSRHPCTPNMWTLVLSNTAQHTSNLRSGLYDLDGVPYVYLAVAARHFVLHMAGDGLANP